MDIKLRHACSLMVATGGPCSGHCGPGAGSVQRVYWGVKTLIPFSMKLCCHSWLLFKVMDDVMIDH